MKIEIVDSHVKIRFQIKTPSTIKGYTTFKSSAPVASQEDANLLVSIITGNIVAIRNINTNLHHVIHLLDTSNINTNLHHGIHLFDTGMMCYIPIYTALQDNPNIIDWLASKPLDPAEPLEYLQYFFRNQLIPGLLKIGNAKSAMAITEKFDTSYIPNLDALKVFIKISYDHTPIPYDPNIAKPALLAYIEHLLNNRWGIIDSKLPKDITNIILEYSDSHLSSRKSYEETVKKLRTYVKWLNFKKKVIYTAIVTHSAMNFAIDTIRTIKEPNTNNAFKTILSASHLYSIHQGFNNYAAIAFTIACTVNIAIRISNGENEENVKALWDLFISASFKTASSMAIPAFAAYTKEPCMGHLVASSIIFLELAAAASNGLSVYHKWGTDTFELGAAKARINLVGPIAKLNLPIISDIASNILYSAVQTINYTSGKLLLAEAESYIRLRLLNESSLKINHVNILFHAQDYNCIETEIDTTLMYHCYNPESAGIELVAIGSDSCVLEP